MFTAIVIHYELNLLAQFFDVHSILFTEQTALCHAFKNLLRVMLIQRDGLVLRCLNAVVTELETSRQLVIVVAALETLVDYLGNQVVCDAAGDEFYELAIVLVRLLLEIKQNYLKHLEYLLVIALYDRRYAFLYVI